jgi:hypothetical protein
MEEKLSKFQRKTIHQQSEIEEDFDPGKNRVYMIEI